MQTLLLLLLTLGQAAGTTQSGGHLAFTAPDGWKTRPASSGMRVAEFVIPHTGKDSEDAELVVYFFGGGGGSVDANIARWTSQMKQPEGSDSKAVAQRTTKKINDLDVTLVDVMGTYVAEMSPGATEHYNKPGYRLRAAVVQTPRGPYYIKMTGPSKTVSDATPGFDAFINSLKFEGAK